MPWMQVSLVLTGDLEVIDEMEMPLLMVTPMLPVVVGDQSGKMCLTMSSRPWFVPLTAQEASLVKDALATEDVSVLRLLSEIDPPAFMTTGQRGLSSE